MERKGLNGTAAVALESGITEKRALRVGQNAPVDLSAPLPRAAGKNAELADELTLIEMQLLRSMRAHGRAPAARQGGRTVAPLAVATPSKTKDKIVRALRKKR
jgi:hypothetical protein